MQAINNINISDEHVAEILKLSNTGLGIAKLDGFVIFVENACPGDKVKVKITKKNKNYAVAKILDFIEYSPDRIEPFCKMQKICGACQIQFINYDTQLKLKKEIVQDIMHSLLGENVEVRDVIPGPQTREYRHKIQYPVSQTKDSKKIIAGYFKQNSHELINIKHCPIQPKYCDDIIEYIKYTANNCGISGYYERKHSGNLRHIVIRTSAANKKNLIILVVNDTKLSPSVKFLAEKIYKELDNISGVCVNYNNKKTNLILGEKTELIFGNDYIEENLCGKIFKIGAKTFFQVNPKSANNIFEYIKNYIKSNYNRPVILDAYAGIAAFGICLSDIAKKVISVEEVKESIELASDIINKNKIDNVELHNIDMSKMEDTNYEFDITIVDPPRKGCTQESLNYILKLTKKQIIYVSCNPATLARDLKYLKENGCIIQYIQPFDMFPHTYHIECVAIINI